MERCAVSSLTGSARSRRTCAWPSGPYTTRSTYWITSCLCLNSSHFSKSLKTKFQHILDWNNSYKKENAQYQSPSHQKFSVNNSYLAQKFNKIWEHESQHPHHWRPFLVLGQFYGIGQIKASIVKGPPGDHPDHPIGFKT